MAKQDKTKSEVNQTRNWYRDRYETVVTQRNFLGTIALVSLTLALVSGLVILMLIPSKTVMPFLIQVDEKTGYTTFVDPKSKDNLTADEALRKYFVVKFVQAREGYDSVDIDQNSNVMRLLADQPIYRKYWADIINPSNKQSLYNTMGTQRLRQVEIKSVQFIDANRAQVRMKLTEITKASNSSEKPQHYVAYVKFSFQNIDLTLEDMLVNPLGFRVLEYRIDEDSAL